MITEKRHVPGMGGSLARGGRVDFANTLRGFAAIAVVIYGVFWLNPAAVEGLIHVPALPEDHPVPPYVAAVQAIPLLNWGAYGVALFFLVSGFVIPFSLQRNTRGGFLVNRLLRIVPTYAAGFSITLLALFVGTRYFETAWPYGLPAILVHYLPGLRDVLWSPNIDGIVWTLEIEMKFYLVCALVLPWFRRASPKVFAVPVALVLLFLVLNPRLESWAVGRPDLYRLALTTIFASQFIVFMFAGVVFHYLYRGLIPADRAYLSIGTLFATFCAWWWAGPHSASLPVAWNYAFALLTFAAAFSWPESLNGNRLFNFFANISYPLYVIHGVGGYVLLRFLIDIGIGPLPALVVATAGCVALSWGLHVLVERPSQRFGRRLGRRVNDSLAPESSPA